MQQQSTQLFQPLFGLVFELMHKYPLEVFIIDLQQMRTNFNWRSDKDNCLGCIIILQVNYSLNSQIHVINYNKSFFAYVFDKFSSQIFFKKQLNVYIIYDHQKQLPVFKNDSSSQNRTKSADQQKNKAKLIFICQIMANLLVKTSNSDELARMEQEYHFREGYFHVPAEDSFTLEALFRAVSFEYFQNSPPQIAQKITSLAQNSVSRIFNLDLLREMMQMVSIMHGKIALYRQYFLDINTYIGENMDSGQIPMPVDASWSNQDNDKVFALAQMGEMRMTRHLEMDIFQECDLKLKNAQPLQLSEKTQLPQSRRHNPEELPQEFQENNENNISQIFYSAQAQSYYGNNQWWKQENHQNDSSKEITRFDCKAGTPLHQKSIGGLVIEEFKYDLKRQIEIGKDIIKHQQDTEVGKYKKMMKEKLLTAKLKKKKKK